ncbi:ribonuclease PH [Nostoc sp. RF31YmG]|nr:ribonuclease PH [Nostoc sp. RF31YmG]
MPDVALINKILMMLKVSKVKKGDCNKFGIVLLEAGTVMIKP